MFRVFRVAGWKGRTCLLVITPGLFSEEDVYPPSYTGMWCGCGVEIRGSSQTARRGQFLLGVRHNWLGCWVASMIAWSIISASFCGS